MTGSRLTDCSRPITKRPHRTHACAIGLARDILKHTMGTFDARGERGRANVFAVFAARAGRFGASAADAASGTQGHDTAVTHVSCSTRMARIVGNILS